MLFTALPASTFDDPQGPATDEPPLAPALAAFVPVPFPEPTLLTTPLTTPLTGASFVPPAPFAFGAGSAGLSAVQLLSQTPLARTSQPDKERQLLHIFITAPEEQADLLLQLPARWLDDGVCQRVYSAIHELAASMRTVNMHSVTDQIRSQFPLPEQQSLLLGYAALLGEPILDTTENLLYQVRQAYQCRVYFQLMQDGNRAFIRNESIESLYDHATKTLLSAEQETSRRLPLVQIVEQCYEDIMNPPEQAQGLSTGLKLFDDTIGGIIPDRMIVFGGLTGAGKTAACIDLTDRLLSRHADKLAILWISLEMSEGRLMNRLYARKATITTDRMRDHMKPGREPLQASERARLYDAHQVIRGWMPSLEIHYGSVDASHIRQLGRRFCLKHQPTGKQCLIFIDHVGMVEHSGKSGDNIRAEFINSMKAIKSLQMDFGATTIPLVQLVKSVKSESRKDSFFRPHTGDIAESGFIEQTADSLLLWWRPEAYATELGRQTMFYGNNADWDMRGRTIGIMGKNRDGQNGIDLVFDSRVQFSELSDSTRLDYL